MENQEKRSGWRIWLYLTPVYLLLLWPLARWSMNMKAGDLNLSKEDYSAFASSEGEIKQWGELTEPEFVDGVLRVSYRTGGYASKAAFSGIKKTDVSEAQSREQTSVGYQTGYLTKAVGAAMRNPKAVKALLDNKYVVAGFMSRGTVKQATSSPEALKEYLRGPGPVNFIDNPVVKAALNDPAVLSAVASSGMIDAMLDTPAAKALMNNPDAVADLVESNPELVNLARQDPRLMRTLLSNPDIGDVLGKFDTSKVDILI